MKKLLAAFLLSLFLPNVAFAADVLLDACTKDDSVDSCSTCDTTAHTVAADANYLVVFVGTDTDRTAAFVTGVTWDFGGTAQDMTPAVEDSHETATHGASGWAFVLANPTTGNKTLRVTTSSSSQCCDIKICSFKNVNTSDPLGTIVETESTATDDGDSLAFTDGSGVMAVAYLISQGPWTNFAQGSDQTEQQRSEATSCGIGDCWSIVTTATVSPIDYTWNSTGNDYWHVVIPLNAAASGSTRRRVF